MAANSKSRWKSLLINLLILGLGVVLFYFAFRKVALGEVKEALRTADYSILPLIFFVALASHVIRVWRWKLLLKPLSPTFSFWSVYHSLMIGYMTSYAIPRVGEITRCGVLAQKTNQDFRQILGTVITERAIDVISLGISVLLSLALEYQEIKPTLETYIMQPLLDQWKQKQASILLLIAAGIFMAAIGFLIWYKFHKNFLMWKPYEKIWNFALSVGTGVQTILKMKRSYLFLLWTMLIWVCYFLMTYLWFWCFPSSAHLDWTAGMAVNSVSSIGRSIPIQGMGMGAYHFLVSTALVAYGVNRTVAGSLALLIHTFNSIYQIGMGAISYLTLTGKMGKIALFKATKSP